MHTGLRTKKQSKKKKKKKKSKKNQQQQQQKKKKPSIDTITDGGPESGCATQSTHANQNEMQPPKPVPGIALRCHFHHSPARPSNSATVAVAHARTVHTTGYTAARLAAAEQAQVARPNSRTCRPVDLLGRKKRRVRHALCFPCTAALLVASSSLLRCLLLLPHIAFHLLRHDY